MSIHLETQINISGYVYQHLPLMKIAQKQILYYMSTPRFLSRRLLGRVGVRTVILVESLKNQSIFRFLRRRTPGHVLTALTQARSEPPERNQNGNRREKPKGRLIIWGPRTRVRTEDRKKSDTNSVTESQSRVVSVKSHHSCDVTVD